VVVRRASEPCRDARHQRCSMPRASVVLAGLTLTPSLHTQLPPHSRLPEPDHSDLMLGVEQPTSSSALLLALSPTGLSGQLLRASPGLTSGLREGRIGLSAYGDLDQFRGNFAPSGGPDVATGYTFSGSDPASSYGFGQTPVGIPAAHIPQPVQPAGSGVLNAVPASPSEQAGPGGVDLGLAPAELPGGQAACTENQTERNLQAGGQFWNSQALSAPPSAFPLSVLTASAQGHADPLQLGPVGGRSNVPSPGPAGSWCLPPPSPTSASDPLEQAPLMVPIGILVAFALVFWLTRGVKMPH